MSEETFDWVVVGAGFSGSTFARIRAEKFGESVLIIEQRDHVGGNAFDPETKTGLRYHAYGPHIFHTNSSKVFEFLSRFTDWIPYEHRVLGALPSELLPIPFNFSTLKGLDEALFRSALPQLLNEYGPGAEVPVVKLMANENILISAVGKLAYEAVFVGYTKKQWGVGLDELSPSVGARVPVRLDYDDRYFKDSFQLMPKDGYLGLFNELLNHPLIEVRLECAFNASAHKGITGVVYTGALDALNDYSLGALPYRSLRFEFEELNVERFQNAGQINYPLTEEYTRISEFKYLTGQVSKSTIIAREYPEPHLPGVNIPYYPVPKDVNQEVHLRYLELTKQRYPKLIPLGRLADYKYYNMDQAVARAIQVANDYDR